jgi:hypothetical protein
MTETPTINKRVSFDTMVITAPKISAQRHVTCGLQLSEVHNNHRVIVRYSCQDLFVRPTQNLQESNDLLGTRSEPSPG